jgi:hypothetical protein
MGLILIVPPITTLFAKRAGRSDVKWFFISMALPLIATFFLCIFFPIYPKKNKLTIICHPLYNAGSNP